MAAHSTTKGLGGWFMATVVLASILNPLNTSSLATALVAIGDALNASAAQLGSLVAAVYVTSAVAQPVMGTLANRWGARRVLLGGMALVMASGIVGGLAAGIPGLLASRILIGLGTSSAVPAGLVMLRRRADALGIKTPTRQLAALTAAGNVTAAAGLPVGGVLVHFLGWRAVVWMNTPLAAVALLLGVIVLTRADDATATSRVRLDVVGIALFAVTIVSTAVYLGHGAWSTWQVVTVAIVAIMAACALFVWEHRQAASDKPAFIDVTLLAHHRVLRHTYLRAFMLSTSVYVTLYAVSQWLETQHGLNAVAVGMFMLPQSVLAAVAGMWVGRRVRIRRDIVTTGLLLLLAGVLLATATATATVTASSGHGAVVAVAVVGATTLAIGTAFGIGMVSNQTALYQASTTARFGVASGLLRTSSYVGGFVASAIMGLVFGSGATTEALRGFVVVFIFAGLFTVFSARTFPFGTSGKSGKLGSSRNSGSFGGRSGDFCIGKRAKLMARPGAMR